jgi:serine/threonine protein kinase
MDSLYTTAELDFKQFKKIGSGGEGNVYKSFDRQLNKTLAFKALPINKFQKESLFFEEAKKLHISSHHNVVPILYGCKNEEFIFLAMPLYKKGSLKNIIDKRFLSAREIIRYSLQFLSGLNNIHSKQLLHFDIKLENILLSDSNHALISDFGVAQYSGKYGLANQHGTTAIYAPPEYFIQAEHNVKFDIYQAGITLYRMCIGDIKFMEQVKNAHIFRKQLNKNNFINALTKGDFPDRSFYFSHIPRPLRTVIRRALNPDVNIRYSTVIEMMNDIASISNANDWILETDFATHEIWSKPNYELIASLDNGLWSVQCKKKGRKNNTFCDEKLNISKKNALTYKCLTSTW